LVHQFHHLSSSSVVYLLLEEGYELNLQEILTFFEQNANPAVAKQQALYHFPQVYGLRMTQMRSLGKQVGKNHDLGLALLKQDSYESILLALLVLDPKKLTSEDFDTLDISCRKSYLVDQALCDLIFQSHQEKALLSRWFNHSNDTLRYTFYALFSSHCRQSDLDDINSTFGIQVLDTIKNTILNEDSIIQNAMNNAVVMAGLHVPDFIEKAYEVSRHIGYVLPTKAKNSCNIQSAEDYLNRYLTNPKYSRCAKLQQSKKE